MGSTIYCALFLVPKLDEKIMGNTCNPVEDFTRPAFRLAPEDIQPENQVEKISVYDGPVNSKKIPPQKKYSWPELFKLLIGEPECLPDNKSETKAKYGYYTRGNIKNGYRDDEHLGLCYVVILDVDKSIDGLPLPTPKESNLALKDIKHVAHSTATPGRSRITLPVEPYQKEDTDKITRAAYHFLRSRGLNFKYAGESSVKSQPWFLPQTTDYEAHQAYGKLDGEMFDPSMVDLPEPEPTESLMANLPERIESKSDHNPMRDFIADLKSGTIHQAAKKYAGWLVKTSNLSMRQVFDELDEIIKACCTDKEKISRWFDDERAGLEKWFVSNVGDKNNNETTTELAVRDWPILNEKALYGFAGKFVKFATQNSEADPAAVLATFLVRFGVELSEPCMWVGDARHKPLLASVIVGASSKARKGTSGKPVNRLFEPMVVESGELALDRAKTTPGPFSSGEGIIHAVRDAVIGVDKKTGEPLQVDPGVDDKRLFVLDEEFAGAMAQTKREGNTLSMIIRAAWDGNTLDPLTKTTKIRATKPHIGWISHITLNELNTRLSETEMFNGYANRILWVCAKRSKLIAWPEPMDSSQLATFQYELSEILAAHQESVTVSPDQEVRRIWQEKYYQDLTQDKPGMIGCVVNRAEAQVLRLAMIYSLIGKSHTIRIEHLEAALAFWQYCEDSAKYIFHSRQSDTVAQKIIDALQEDPMTGTEIHRLFNSHVTKPRLESALSELTAADRIATEKKSTGGRPVITYFLKSPRVLSVKSVKSPDLTLCEPLNTLNTLFTPSENEKASTQYEENV